MNKKGRKVKIKHRKNQDRMKRKAHARRKAAGRG